MKRTLKIIAGVLVVAALLASLWCFAQPRLFPKRMKAVSAKGVRLVSSELKGGQATQTQLKEGLQSAAEEISAAYVELRKIYPELKGNLRGVLRTRPDGTVLSFTDIRSQFTPVLPPKTFADLVGNSFWLNSRFPVDNALFLMVDFQLEPD